MEMINNAQNKVKIRDLLLSTQRRGIKELITYIGQKGFFTSPASTRFHGNYNGGLADHSFNVYKLFKAEIKFLKNLGIDINIFDDEIIIASLLHDICKAGQYINGKWNKEHPKGHACLSLKIIKRYIKLTSLEEELILYHMGYFGSKEFSEAIGYDYAEYTLSQLTSKSEHNPLIRLFHWCDDMASQFVDKKI